MDEESSTVQNGQSDDGGYGVMSQPIDEAICVTMSGCCVVEGLSANGSTVYALTVRGHTMQDQDVQVDATLLLRIADAAQIVATITSTLTRDGKAIPFATLLGAATERERHQPSPFHGKLFDHDTAQRLIAAQGKDGLLDPAEVADVLAGRVPAQPDGE